MMLLVAGPRTRIWLLWTLAIHYVPISLVVPDKYVRPAMLNNILERQQSAIERGDC